MLRMAPSRGPQLALCPQPVRQLVRAALLEVDEVGALCDFSVGRLTRLGSGPAGGRGALPRWGLRGGRLGLSGHFSSSSGFDGARRVDEHRRVFDARLRSPAAWFTRNSATTRRAASCPSATDPARPIAAPPSVTEVRFSRWITRTRTGSPD